MSFENKNLHCKYCRFWWLTAEGTGNELSHERSILGQCGRQAPPAMSADLPDYGRRNPARVTTKREDWCGEHQHVLN